MTEKLKYKVGDKVLVEAEVTQTDSGGLPYRLETFSGDFLGWHQAKFVKGVLDVLPPKPKIPQAVMDYYLKYRDRDWIFGTWFSFESMSYEVQNWLYSDKKLKLQRQHALATLIAYGPQAVEVEKEKIYKVKFMNLMTSDGKEQFLTHDIPKRKVFASRHRMNLKQTFTKGELVSLGFEGVFDNPMFEAEEVE